MTNTLNTPIEALEYAYPLRLRQYSLRPGSGGEGRFRGGDGIIRETEILAPSRVTLLSERRVFAPYGLAGGEPGQPGRNVLFGAEASRPLPGKTSFDAMPGDILRIETPGGGGHGRSQHADGEQMGDA
jgi:N-methylhydantoinase B